MDSARILYNLGITSWGNQVPEREGAWLRNRVANATDRELQGSRTGRILIVARPSYSKALSSTLSNAGHEVHRTPDAAGAVEAARRLRPQMAIVSMDLPGSSGLAVAKLLRSSQPQVPVILLGIPIDHSDTQEFVRVPYDIGPAILLRTVEEQLNTSHYHDETSDS